MGTILLIHLAGSIALLLWGTHMVSSSILRGFGSLLRNWLGRYLHSRGMSILAGVGLTALLQSSTAASMMTVSLTTTGIITLVPALAVMLGANIGTTLVVQVLSFDTSLLSPILILIGVILYRSNDTQRIESIGQALIGLGLMLLALANLHYALIDVEHAKAFAVILQSISGDPIITLLLAALLTWLCYSSVTTVLLIASLSLTGFITVPDCLAMVLGANLGGALPAFTSASGNVAKRLPLGNLLVRLTGCLLFLPLLPYLSDYLQPLFSADKITVYFHTFFNLLLAVLFIGLLEPLANLLTRLLPEPNQSHDPSLPLYLDEAGLEVTNIGLANATREILHATDLVEQMQEYNHQLLINSQANNLIKIQQIDGYLDKLSVAIRAYLADIGQDGITDEDADRNQALLIFIINIEHIGDITSTNIAPLIRRRQQQGENFPKVEMDVLVAMQQKIAEGIKLAVSAFLYNDKEALKRLSSGKKFMRRLEQHANRGHSLRVKKDRIKIDSGEMYLQGQIYLRLLRDYRRLYRHLVELSNATNPDEKKNYLENPTDILLDQHSSSTKID